MLYRLKKERFSYFNLHGENKIYEAIAKTGKTIGRKENN
jgi:hypothetical protein